eukprot:712894-Ditylum_brightwellii.AAC.1
MLGRGIEAVAVEYSAHQCCREVKPDDHQRSAPAVVKNKGENKMVVMEVPHCYQTKMSSSEDKTHRGCTYIWTKSRRVYHFWF